MEGICPKCKMLKLPDHTCRKKPKRDKSSKDKPKKDKKIDRNLYQILTRESHIFIIGDNFKKTNIDYLYMTCDSNVKSYQTTVISDFELIDLILKIRKIDAKDLSLYVKRENSNCNKKGCRRGGCHFKLDSPYQYYKIKRGREYLIK